MTSEQSCWIDNLFDQSDKLPVHLDDLGDIDEELYYLGKIEVNQRDQSFSNKIRSATQEELEEEVNMLMDAADKKAYEQWEAGSGQVATNLLEAKIPEIPEITDKKYSLVPTEILDYADFLMIEAAKKIKILERENTWLREQAWILGRGSMRAKI